jgi:hypothetical protein
MTPSVPRFALATVVSAAFGGVIFSALLILIGSSITIMETVQQGCVTAPAVGDAPAGYTCASVLGSMALFAILTLAMMVFGAAIGAVAGLFYGLPMAALGGFVWLLLRHLKKPALERIVWPLIGFIAGIFTLAIALNSVFIAYLISEPEYWVLPLAALAGLSGMWAFRQNILQASPEYGDPVS